MSGWNLFKDDIVMSGFQDCCYSNLENENTLAIEMRKRFIEAATKRCSSSLCLAATIEII